MIFPKFGENQFGTLCSAFKLNQGKLNIVPGKISTVGLGENLGVLTNTEIFSIFIKKSDFHGTNSSPDPSHLYTVVPGLILEYSLLFVFVHRNYS
jgi:hypothetical protein